MVSRKKRGPLCSSVLPEIVRNRPLRTTALSSAGVRTKHPDGCLRRITGHLKASISIFILAVLAAGSVVAHENGASSATAEAASITDQVHQIFERVIDERIIDCLDLFDRSDEGSARYGISLDLENEDGDWNVEVTVSMEF